MYNCKQNLTEAVHKRAKLLNRKEEQRREIFFEKYFCAGADLRFYSVYTGIMMQLLQNQQLLGACRTQTYVRIQEDEKWVLLNFKHVNLTR